MRNLDLNPLVHSFIGNLVWLPREVAKYTDEEGGFGQNLLKEISWAIFRTNLSDRSSTSLVERIWQYLPPPESSVLSSRTPLNVAYFDIDIDRFSDSHHGLMRAILYALERIEAEGSSVILAQIKYPPRSLCVRYSENLPSMLESSCSFLRLKDILHQALSMARSPI